MRDTGLVLIARGFRFGVVGLIAAASQASLLVILNRGGLSGFAANLVGWAVSVGVSYFGQSRWTFRDRERRSVLRFLAIAIMAFSVSSGGAWLIIDRAHASPLFVLPIILFVVPGLSFCLMWAWAFKKGAGSW